MSRRDFRELCVERDNQQCVVPWCDEPVLQSPDKKGEVHHIIERKLWENGGYIEDNGASVCNYHHRLAENDIIPPQAFWMWIGIENPPLPDDVSSMGVDKWGQSIEMPPWKEHRDIIKYPSTRHLPWSHEQDRDDTSYKNVENFLNYPLVSTIKMDGSNSMIVKDKDNPVRARNGRTADKEHFDMLKKMYWENNLYKRIPNNIQIFGEWLYAKHSIHYGCQCENECGDSGPKLRDYFQVFGIYNNYYDVWLSWDSTLKLSKKLGLTVVPSAGDDYFKGSFERKDQFWDYFVDLSKQVVQNNHEGIVVRSRFPIHYSQISKRLGKYVRDDHVMESEKHWSNRELKKNLRK